MKRSVRFFFFFFKILSKKKKKVGREEYASAEHECEELKGGVWLEPIHAVLRRKTNESGTDMHRNVMRKVVVEGGWGQKRRYDT